MSHSNGAVIAEIVAKLLNHFGTTEEPLAVRKAIAHDWVEDLAEFTLPQVEWAAKEWRRNQSLRPTIADIRRLATQAQQNDIKARAITDRNTLDAETLRLWDQPEYEGDARSPQERRADAIRAQEERYRRAAQIRAGLCEQVSPGGTARAAAPRAECPEDAQWGSDAVPAPDASAR